MKFDNCWNSDSRMENADESRQVSSARAACVWSLVGGREVKGGWC